MMFVADFLRGDEPMTVLCARYGISRETGYVWKRRYELDGPIGLEDRSRAPHRHGRATPADLMVRLMELRKRKPYWGPKKLMPILRAEDPDAAWPSLSTASEILRREGLSQPRRRRRGALPVDQPFGQVEAANDVWCIDFKGWFTTDDGHRCDPLTVTDAFSRYLLAVQIVPPVSEAVRAQMARLFETHGAPGAIRSDNGSPFASVGARGLTRLSARWAKMGIRLERIRPGHPQQNGSHERMHGTLKPEACVPPSATAAEQQVRFDVFQREFNEERPHEALGQKPPASFYIFSTKPFVDPAGDIEYGPDEVVRRVRKSGEIKWRGEDILIGDADVGGLFRAINEDHEGARQKGFVRLDQQSIQVGAEGLEMGRRFLDLDTAPRLAPAVGRAFPKAVLVAADRAGADSDASALAIQHRVPIGGRCARIGAVGDDDPLASGPLIDADGATRGDRRHDAGKGTEYKSPGSSTPSAIDRRRRS
jgi:transposase InsO family protein